jgi:CBS domain-containing protein
MSTDLQSVNSNTSLRDVDLLLKDYQIHHILVIGDGNLKGMISKTDMDRIAFVDATTGVGVDTTFYDILTVDHVMTNNLVTIQQDQPIRAAAELFSSGKFHALPVLDGDEIVGIVTTTDLIRYLVDTY